MDELAPGKDVKTSWQIPRMPSARFVEAELLNGCWLRVWLQNETVYGYWVQDYEAEGPYRLVEEIREIEYVVSKNQG